jgi:hypothetical protein
MRRSSVNPARVLTDHYPDRLTSLPSEPGFMLRAWNVDDTTVHTLKGRTTDTDRVTHE